MHRLFAFFLATTSLFVGCAAVKSPRELTNDALTKIVTTGDVREIFPLVSWETAFALQQDANFCGCGTVTSADELRECCYHNSRPGSFVEKLDSALREARGTMSEQKWLAKAKEANKVRGKVLAFPEMLRNLRFNVTDGAVERHRASVSVETTFPENGASASLKNNACIRLVREGNSWRLGSPDLMMLLGLEYSADLTKAWNGWPACADHRSP